MTGIEINIKKYFFKIKKYADGDHQSNHNLWTTLNIIIRVYKNKFNINKY